jgi:ribose/xylose/arabinose/galactoside ABC-type transport system permease subunit
MLCDAVRDSRGLREADRLRDRVSATGARVWAYPLCLVAGVVLGLINGIIVTRVRIPSLIATLGTGGILPASPRCSPPSR